MSKTDEGRDYAAHYKSMWEDALAKWRKDAERISALEARVRELEAAAVKVFEGYAAGDPELVWEFVGSHLIPAVDDERARALLAQREREEK